MIFLKKVPKILGTFCLLMIIACKQDFKSLKYNYKDKFLETQARYTDIAIPLGITNFKPIDLGFEYYVSEKMTDVSKFYAESMELYGWQILAHSKNIYVYEKPHKLAIVEIQQSNKLQKITVRSVSKNS
jgi:hypothetical protein